MSNIKYTKDGKKVNVVGKLNNADYIVQEIFVTDDGAEIPAGENFVVSSLLDEPVKSWKENNLEKLEAKYARDRDAWERSIEKQSRELKLKHDTIKEHCKAAKALLQDSVNLPGDLMGVVESVMDFVSGNITHLFIDRYQPEIQKFEDAVIDEDRGFGRILVDGLKLITLFGKTDGSLEWRLNRYSDGSGGSTIVYPARSYDEGLEMAQDRLDELAAEYVAGEIRSLNIDEWRKIEGIKIPKDAEKLQNQQKAENLRKTIEKQQAELEKNTQALKELSDD